jgi:hypothetical protein
VNLRSEGTNPRATGTNPRTLRTNPRATEAGPKPQPKGPVITNADELRDFLAQFPPKRRRRKARSKAVAIAKEQWQSTLQEITANAAQQTSQRIVADAN